MPQPRGNRTWVADQEPVKLKRLEPWNHLTSVRSVWPKTLLRRSHRYRFQSRVAKRDDFHSKLLFFVKNKGQWNAKSGPNVADGNVAMRTKFSGRLESKWERTGRNWSNFAHTHTHAAKLVVDITIVGLLHPLSCEERSILIIVHPPQKVNPSVLVIIMNIAPMMTPSGECAWEMLACAAIYM